MVTLRTTGSGTWLPTPEDTPYQRLGGSVAAIRVLRCRALKTLRTYLKYEKVQEQEKRLERAVEAGDR